MLYTPDALRQVAEERGRDLRAAAAARNLAQPEPTRRRVAQAFRSAANRLDAATAPCGQLRDAIPERS